MKENDPTEAEHNLKSPPHVTAKSWKTAFRVGGSLVALGLAVLPRAEWVSGGLLGSGFASGCFHSSFLRAVFPPQLFFLSYSCGVALLYK